MPDAETVERRQALFLKKILEGAARVVGTGGGGGRGGGFAFARHADRVEAAIVAGVFGGQPRGNRFGALPARCGVEVKALLATMQIEAAAPAAVPRVEPLGQQSAAVGATGNGDAGRKLRRARA